MLRSNKFFAEREGFSPTLRFGGLVLEECKLLIPFLFCGEGGIRTLGELAPTTP